MLPVARRALVIAALGPAIQVLGLLWLCLHLAVRHLHEPIDPRHLLFEGGFLTIGAGLLISIVCIPVALEVARASEDDVALKQFGDAMTAGAGRVPRETPRLQRRRQLGASK